MLVGEFNFKDWTYICPRDGKIKDFKNNNNNNNNSNVK